MTSDYGSCRCGRTRFSHQGVPIVRYYCHCLICQSFYRRPFADVTMVRASNLSILDIENVEFRRHRPPPALQRGACHHCGFPVASFLRSVPFVHEASVPSMNFPDQSRLPEPGFHIFYHHRVADIDDEFPKYRGHWKSEWVAGKRVIATLIHRQRRA